MCSDGRQGDHAGCIKNEDCDDKHVCFQNKCEMKEEEGGECGEDDHCMEGLKCMEGQGEMAEKTCKNPDGSGSAEGASSESSEAEAAKAAAVEKGGGEGGDPRYQKYFKMLKSGVPRGAVEQKMTREGVDPKILDERNMGSTDEAAPEGGDTSRSSDNSGGSESKAVAFKSLRGDPFESSYSATEDKVAKAEARYRQLFGGV